MPQTDTLQILSKQPYEKRLKEAQKSFEEWKKKEEKKRKRGEPYDSIMPPKELEFKLQLDSKLDPDRNIRFELTRHSPLPTHRRYTSTPSTTRCGTRHRCASNL